MTVIDVDRCRAVQFLFALFVSLSILFRLLLFCSHWTPIFEWWIFSANASFVHYIYFTVSSITQNCSPVKMSHTVLFFVVHLLFSLCVVATVYLLTARYKLEYRLIGRCKLAKAIILMLMMMNFNAQLASVHSLMLLCRFFCIPLHMQFNDPEMIQKRKRERLIYHRYTELRRDIFSFSSSSFKKLQFLWKKMAFIWNRFSDFDTKMTFLDHYFAKPNIFLHI